MPVVTVKREKGEIKNMYSRQTLDLLMIKNDYYYDECEKYCLLEPQNAFYTTDTLHAHANFIILYAVGAYKEHKIQEYELNSIYDKIEALLYAEDMLGIKRIIEKLNKEILEDLLNETNFHYICVRCNNDQN